MRHREIKRNLSAYLDRELSQNKAQAVARHLDTCWVCQKRIREIQPGRTAGTFFKEPIWEGRERLWADIQREKISSWADTAKASRVPQFFGRMPELFGLRPAFTVGMILLLVLGNLFLTLRPQKSEYRKARIDWTPAYAFAFGLLLEELAAGTSTDNFELRYESQPSTYESVGSHIPFKLASFRRVPKPFRLQEVRLLKSACCRSVQFVCWKKQKCVLIFQQPKGHPVTFGAYPIEKVRYNGQFVHRVKAGAWTALSWEGADSQFVAVGELSEADLMIVVKAITPI